MSQDTRGAGRRDHYPSRIKALTALAAEADRAHREATPHADLPVDGLPDGWRLTQTQAEHDDGRWRLHAPGGQIAGTVVRVAYGGRRPEWRATAGDPGRHTALRTTITPSPDDPDRGSDYDLFRTRTAAARALAHDHDPAWPPPNPIPRTFGEAPSRHVRGGASPSPRPGPAGRVGRGMGRAAFGAQRRSQRPKSHDLETKIQNFRLSTKIKKL